MAEQSQSENCLAVSGDFSDSDSSIGCENDLEVELLNEEQQFIKQRLSSSSSSSDTSASASLKSRTVSSLSLSLNPNLFHPQATALPALKRWIVLPACTLTFMVVLPFINGCLYTIGYRIGKLVLKMILNKSIKN